MDVFVYFAPNLEVSKDEIEDALDEAIGELGEVTGGGIGNAGMNIDLDVEDDVAPQKIADLITGALKELGLAAEKIVIRGVPYGR